MPNQKACRFLPWDSRFFGRRIARLNRGRLTAPLCAETLAWCRDHHIACLYFLADAQDALTLKLAEANRFHLVDMRVDYQWRGSSKAAAGRSSWAGVLRPSRRGDIPALQDIARLNHRDSRFYFDGHFSPAQCQALYETWIAKSCQGYANMVWVAEMAGRAVGYVSCHRVKSNQGRIGLVGVAKESQHQGLGYALMQKSIEWFVSLGIQKIHVATQARNVAAQRLYQRCAFLVHSTQWWYHRWFSSTRT